MGMNENPNWKELIKEWQKSAKSQAEFCREKAIRVSLFGYHYRKNAISPEPKKEFIEIPVKSKEKGSLLSLEVGNNGEIVIRIKTGS